MHLNQCNNRALSQHHFPFTIIIGKRSERYNLNIGKELGNFAEKARLNRGKT